MKGTEKYIDCSNLIASCRLMGMVMWSHAWKLLCVHEWPCNEIIGFSSGLFNGSSHLHLSERGPFQSWTELECVAIWGVTPS